jgi:hypothetical protein
MPTSSTGITGMRRVVTLLVVTAAVGFAPGPARAGQSCQDVAPNRQECEVGIPSVAADTIASVQESNVWCWAASAQMIFAYYGLHISQGRIVATVFGRAVPTTASNADMDRLLTSRYVDDAGDLWQVSYRTLPPTLAAVIPELREGNPLLITTSRHAMVLTALDYAVSPEGEFTTAAIVRDPWPQPETFRGSTMGPDKRILSAAEYNDIRITSRIYVTRI